MLGTFDADKVAEAAALLLAEQKGWKMSRLRLLKLLYIADRESIQETGFSITSDDVVAMEHGPVLSRTYDLIKGQGDDAPRWGRYIQPAGARDVMLAREPPRKKLSRYDEEKLRDVARRF